MNERAFEAKVLQMWTETRVPMTRANIVAYTKAPRDRAEKWLDAMVKADVLDLDVTEDGDIVWHVRGADRPKRGAEVVGEATKMETLTAEVDRIKSTAALALQVAGVKKPESVEPAKRKSLLVSGALSFFFGPFGWLYAAPLKEAIPAIVVTVILLKLLPSFLLMYLGGMLAIASGVAGVAYAWSHNVTGGRAPLLLKDKEPAKLPIKTRRKE